MLIQFGPLDEIDAYLTHADNPQIPPNTFMNWNICREANKNQCSHTFRWDRR